MGEGCESQEGFVSGLGVIIPRSRCSYSCQTRNVESNLDTVEPHWQCIDAGQKVTLLVRSDGCIVSCGRHLGHTWLAYRDSGQVTMA